MKRLIILVGMLMMMVSASWAAKVEKTITLTINGAKRTYLMYVPEKVKKDVDTPLVFSLHGTGGHSADKAPFRTSVADSEGCIVVYPQGSDIYFPVFGGTLPGWHSTGEWSDDIDFFKAIIEEVAKSYAVDRERIYCCGFSNGGMMTYTVANVASDVFAAFCSISGFPLNEFHLHHSGARPVPFLHIHGKADDFVRYALMPVIVENMVARNGAFPVPEKTKVSGKYDKSVYPATEGGFPYIYYEVDGMGHNDYTDRTEDKNSALTMWKFMKQYTLSSERDETLKWRPCTDAEGYDPNQHGWYVNKSQYLLYFGREQKTNDNQNVYRALQFEKGKFKICFDTEGEEGKMISVKINKLTGNKKSVLSETVPVGGKVTCFFDVEDDWAEYKLNIQRESSSDNIKITNLAIYSATEEEQLASAIHAPMLKEDSRTVYNLSGMLQNGVQKGVNIIGGKKLYIR